MIRGEEGFQPPCHPHLGPISRAAAEASTGPAGFAPLLRRAWIALLLGILLGAPALLQAQDVHSRMEAANQLQQRFDAAFRRPDPEVFWDSGNDRTLIYRVSDDRGKWSYKRVNLATGEIAPAFDHTALAQRLNEMGGDPVSPDSLPLPFVYADRGGEALRVYFNRQMWSFSPDDGTLTATDLEVPAGTLVGVDELFRRNRRNRLPNEPTVLPIENATDGIVSVFWIDFEGRRVPYGTIGPGGRREQETYAGHRWLFVDAHGRELGGMVASRVPVTAHISGLTPALNDATSDVSPDGRWRARVEDGDIVLQPTAGGEPRRLSAVDPAEGSFRPPFYWSPDSTRVVCNYTPRVELRQITIVQSSPPDQLQPKLLTFVYPKAGDPISQPTPCLFDVGSGQQIPIDRSLFSNPWTNSQIAWEEDSSEFSFLYNQRGHQLMRLLAIDARTGSVRTILEETSPTFIDYSQKLTLFRLPSSREVIWASERSGWNHLYLVNEDSGAIRPLTSGDWNVRELVSVDRDTRTTVVSVMGRDPGQDPYHRHYLRIGLDGGEPVRLTQADGDHRIEFSPDERFYLDTWSRVDHPPVVELHRSEDGTLVAELDRGSTEGLERLGWRPPERFVAKGRDGQTDIYGQIYLPTNFDPKRRYPVVEEIYAGPHDFFVPKQFSAWHWRVQDLAELGFVVVKIDGMGTNWRSRAFHDVAWKNLIDAGFPDRIAWIRAAAATRPWMDLERVGLTGGSAGGQNALAGLLRHGDFYKVGVADSGCHDNRMDKIWWNEAWMGWPVDDSYARNSNVNYAADLQGELLLMYGELDTNVDPASSAQMANALQQAGKLFEILPVMNAGHCAADTNDYGAYRRAEFLVRNLLGDESPAAPGENAE